MPCEREDTIIFRSARGIRIPSYALGGPTNASEIEYDLILKKVSRIKTDRQHRSCRPIRLVVTKGRETRGAQTHDKWIPITSRKRRTSEHMRAG